MPLEWVYKIVHHPDTPHTHHAGPGTPAHCRTLLSKENVTKPVYQSMKLSTLNQFLIKASPFDIQNLKSTWQ